MPDSDDTPDFDPDRFAALAAQANQHALTPAERNELCEQLTALQGFLAEVAETTIPLMKAHIQAHGEQSSDWEADEDA